MTAAPHLAPKIRNRILGLLSLIAALLIMAGTSWRLAWLIDSRMLRAQGEQAAVDLDQELTRLRFFPRVLAEDPRLEAALSRGFPADILAANQTLARITEQSGAAFSFLMDTEGYTVAASNYDQPSSFIDKN